eukprot:Colp12_sorted_trinity150504_noHs@16823
MQAIRDPKRRTAEWISWKRNAQKRWQFHFRELQGGSGIERRQFLCAIGVGFLVVTLLVLLLGSSSQTQPLARSPLPRKVSVIVPTFHEVDNIQPLTERVFKAMGDSELEGEMIIVDDNSNDGTEELVNKLAEQGYNIRILVRKTESGLSSAVIKGFEAATFPILVVLDADLQHPPEQIPELAAPIIAGTADFAIGSRYIDGGAMQDWPLYRKIISKGATLLARPLVNVNDPMSGFFCLSMDQYLNAERLNTMGFKIALELMVRSHASKVVEIPINFSDRKAGASKLKLKTQVQYVRQLISLYFFVYPFTSFLAIIAAAVVVVSAVASLASRRRRPGTQPLASV